MVGALRASRALSTSNTLFVITVDRHLPLPAAFLFLRFLTFLLFLISRGLELVHGGAEVIFRWYHEVFVIDKDLRSFLGLLLPILLVLLAMDGARAGASLARGYAALLKHSRIVLLDGAIFGGDG